MFKISVLLVGPVKLDPAKLAPGFEMCEIPAGQLLDAGMSNEEWEKRKAELKSYSLPPMRAASHWLDKPCTTPGVDWDLIEFWTPRVLKRLSELGVSYAGVYGKFFAKVEGYSATRQMDQAIRYANFLGDSARQNNMSIVLEPMGDSNTWFPSYKEGIAFVKRVDHPNVKLMADLNYFLAINEPFDDIKESPELCLHAHIAGDKGINPATGKTSSFQPGVGDMVKIHKDFFRVLRDVKYEGAVTAACAWKSTGTGEFDLTIESAKSLAYMQKLRAEVYNE
jgi:sugar phosphate isomerase/epimerase